MCMRYYYSLLALFMGWFSRVLVCFRTSPRKIYWSGVGWLAWAAIGLIHLLAWSGLTGFTGPVARIRIPSLF